MKTYFLNFFGLMLFLGFCSCSGDKGGNGGGGGNNSESSCSSKNQLSTVKYEGVEQEFKQEHVYANFNKTYNTYRVLYLNYPKSEDSDYGKKKEGQKRVVITLFDPVDGKFTTGKYTFNGDANGKNKIAVQVETAEGLKTCNIANMEEAGFIEVKEISNTNICGTFHVKGEGFEIAGEFNTKHEDVQ